jgi:uridine phosphorylase
MIGPSELLINPDGSIFHLHLKPGEVADTIIMVGDPGRVEMIASYLNTIECTAKNREFISVTGWHNGMRFTVVSTGIGTDNIDIVLNELDALVNIDFSTREIKSEKKSLRIIRIGTSGSLQPNIPINSFVISGKSIGFDGMLNFYAGRNSISDLAFESEFLRHTRWNELLAKPYVVDCSDELLKKLSGPDTMVGINISAPGFYGPQGRIIRLSIVDPQLNEKIEKFRYKGSMITNYEMESSAIYGLSKLLGHEAITICTIIANRVTLTANENYENVMRELIGLVFERITA